MICSVVYFTELGVTVRGMLLMAPVSGVLGTEVEWGREADQVDICS